MALTRSGRRGLLVVLLVLAAACSSADDRGDDSATNDGRTGDTTEATAEPSPVSVPQAPGFDGETIRLGVLTAETGPFADSGQAVTAGNRLYWDALNAAGGVGGQYPVELEVADSEYFESVAVIGYDAIGEEVAAFTQVFGTKSVLAVLPRLRRDGVLAVPAAHDGRWVYEPQLLPVGAPPEVQAANAVAYALESDPAGLICALHQDDTYGTAGFEGVEAALDGLDVDLAASPTFEPIPAGFGEPLDELAAARCATVVFIGLPFHARSALTEAQRRSLDARWLLLSGAWSPTLLDGEALASYLAEHAWVVGEGPEWGDSAVPGMATLVEAHQRHAPDVEPSSEVVDGYRQAQALHQVLEQAVEAGDLSRQGLLAAAGEVGRLRFDGLAGDYDYAPRASDRTPPRASTVFAVDPGQPGGLRSLAEGFTGDGVANIELPAAPG